MSSFRAYKPVIMLGIALAILVSGCSYKSKQILFKTAERIETGDIPVYYVKGDTLSRDSGPVHTIKAGDFLSIRFLNNLSLENGMFIGSRGNVGEANGIQFEVDKDGFVTLPMVGRVDLSGLDRIQAAKVLEKEYSAHLVNPTIEVTIPSMSFTILGEVSRQGQFMMNGEKTSLIEAISIAGGITKRGKLRNVKVIRNQDDNTKQVIIFDLTKESAISKPDFFLADKDIIYVEPRGINLITDQIQPYTTIFSIVTGVTSFALVLYTLFRRP